MKILSNLAVFLLLPFFIEYVNSNEFMKTILQKCYGTCNQKYCNISIACRPLNRTSKLSSMDIYIRPGLKVEAPINIEIIAYKKFRTVYRPFMIKLKEELCAQLNNSNHPYFNRFLAKDFEGNMLDPCPFSGHRFIKPFVPSHDHIPLVPVGEWKLVQTLSKRINNSDEFLVSWTHFYEVKPTGAVEF